MATLMDSQNISQPKKRLRIEEMDENNLFRAKGCIVFEINESDSEVQVKLESNSFYSDVDDLPCVTVLNHDLKAMGESIQKKEINELFACGICLEKFSKLADLHNHIFTHAGHSLKQRKKKKPNLTSGSDTFYCGYCFKQFKSRFLWRKHYKRSHEDDTSKQLFIKTKKEVNANLILFDKDYTSEVGEKLYVCEYCKKKFHSLGGLNYHVNQVHDFRDALSLVCYNCSLCSFKCRQEILWKKHIEEQHNINLDSFRDSAHYLNYSCNFCSHMADNLKDIISHVGNHNICKQYACEACDFITDRKMSYSKHLSFHKSFLCQICARDFCSIDEMKGHVKHEHYDEVFLCDQCEFFCKEKEKFDFHKRFDHTDELPYQCEYCSYQGSIVEVLTTHRKLHLP